MLVQEEFFLYFFLNIFKSYQEVKKVYLNRLKKVYQEKKKKIQQVFSFEVWSGSELAKS